LTGGSIWKPAETAKGNEIRHSGRHNARAPSSALIFPLNHVTGKHLATSYIAFDAFLERAAF
jgi:hypothetical protein